MTAAEKVLEVLKTRLGDIENEMAAMLDIERARVTLLCYCNIPLSADVPPGLFNAWCIAAEQQFTGAENGVSSISEGDVSITFGSPARSYLGQNETDWKIIAMRFRQRAI